MLGYCTKCKKKVEILDGKYFISKNKKRMYKGKDSLGHTVNAIVKNESGKS